MSSLSDRWNRLTGKTRFVVCRIMLHLTGTEVNPLLGVLNRVGQSAIESEGDLEVLGDGLVEICQHLLQLEPYWKAAANEGDVIWEEGEAADYVNELFTDSAQRYLSQPAFGDEDEDETLVLPTTENVVVMLTVAGEGEISDLETDLADIEALRYGLKALINLHYQNKLHAIQVHFSPARFGDELTSEQVLENFPELIPL
ncbi:hypothetical protein CKA32_002819 [Geitlerinema sp. FC II]|uniref:DUF1517 domain-containing protein n=1 Tax=Baaleninema simplex TaxID=2862350 RepID=UPI0003496E91|nr:DUF1517 domain-containing protein [Baaleninema simplex]MDC0832684.1 DUF1517 domain-containing protein [Geitlerinema sp. CS-897]PPT10928.1 hypothetical protein CKA32_002819 [Geitlerinema sp. FC II]